MANGRQRSGQGSKKNGAMKMGDSLGHGFSGSIGRGFANQLDLDELQLDIAARRAEMQAEWDSQHGPVKVLRKDGKPV